MWQVVAVIIIIIILIGGWCWYKYIRNTDTDSDDDSDDEDEDEEEEKKPEPKKKVKGGSNKKDKKGKKNPKRDISALYKKIHDKMVKTEMSVEDFIKTGFNEVDYLNLRGLYDTKSHMELDPASVTVEDYKTAL